MINKYRNDDDYGDWLYDRKVDDMLDRKADEYHTAKLEALSDEEARTRHALLDREGVPAVRKWFDLDLPEATGRFLEEDRSFRWCDDTGIYRTLWCTKINNELYAVSGGTRILGEVRILEEEE